MRVVFFMRRPWPGRNHSVEHMVDGIAESLSPDIKVGRAVSRFLSLGVAGRIYNIVEASLRQGDVNHVTGDVHFLTYLLSPRRTVLTVLDCGRIDGPPDYRKRIVKFFWFSVPVRQAKAITVISEAVKQDLLRHVRVAPEKIHVIPVAVPSVYERIPKSFNAHCPTILQVGTNPNKNLERLFEALSGISCLLRIVGTLSDEHRALLLRWGIRYENYVSVDNAEMLRLYSECDIVSFPSTFEGFGMPIIEGNIVGRPVVTGNATSIPEVAGDAACMVDPFDVKAICDGFLRVISDAPYRELLVKNGYENAKRYDQRTITALYEAVYRRVACSAQGKSWRRFLSPGSRVS
ncbi:MAG: glycosyl transferase group 1 [Myxococcaceae bacterium]|nr:glycosyl transferase group 1 [Myxococcaceae bacterium]